jgi:hypothetical protein
VNKPETQVESTLRLHCWRTAESPVGRAVVQTDGLGRLVRASNGVRLETDFARAFKPMSPVASFREKFRISFYRNS